MLSQASRPGQPGAALLGLLIGATVALARVIDQSHTVPEVIAGWIVGASVAIMFLRKYDQVEKITSS